MIKQHLEANKQIIVINYMIYNGTGFNCQNTEKKNYRSCAGKKKIYIRAYVNSSIFFKIFLTEFKHVSLYKEARPITNNKCYVYGFTFCKAL